MNEGSILLVEDDLRLQQVLAEQLRQQGWLVHTEVSGKGALEIFPRLHPDIVLLDIGLEDTDGLHVCKALREQSDVPIILVTAADSQKTKITALELGGDDYLTKPFYLGELLARMRAVLRRTRGVSESNSRKPLHLGVLQIDIHKYEVSREGISIRLTKTEFDILKELVLNIDKVLTYKHLLKSVWGEGYNDVRALHVHVSHLRRKLEPDISGDRYLLTVSGVGYRLRSCPDLS
jgi:two-component system, OmpR family, KDP operon response regulator KdpE